MVAIARGNSAAFWAANPLGAMVAAVMLVGPVWVLFDVMTQKTTLWGCYVWTERLFRSKCISIPAGLAVIGNWLWNLSKGL